MMGIILKISLLLVVFTAVICKECDNGTPKFVDLVFILDASSSVGQVNFDRMLTFVQNFLRPADIDNGYLRVGLLTYSVDVFIQFYLNDYNTKTDFIRAIGQVPYDAGSTNTAESLRALRTVMFTEQHGDRPYAPNVAVVMTDGVSNVNPKQTVPEARLLHKDKVLMFAIGIGLSDTRELNAIASYPETDHRFTVSNFTELRNIEKKLYKAICIATDENYYPQRHGCVPKKMDLVFILDSSISVTDASFRLVISFIHRVLRDAEIDAGKVRVGLLTYSTFVHIHFHLGQYQSKRTLFRALSTTPYIYGSTNTADALSTARMESFRAVNGARPDAVKIAVIITDSISNINAQNTVREADKARADGITIYAIGVGITDTKEIDGIANSPTNTYRYLINGYQDLSSISDSLDQSLCQESISGGLYGSLSRACGTVYGDLMIALDSSTSVTSTYFNRLLLDLHRTLTAATFKQTDTRIGLVTYSFDTIIRFSLNGYSTIDQVLDVIEDIPYSPGSTNTADMLKKTPHRDVQGETRDRAGYPNSLLIITDGVSDTNPQKVAFEAELLRGHGVRIFVLGVGLLDQAEILAIADKPDSRHAYYADSYADVPNVLPRVLTSLCIESERDRLLPAPKPSRPIPEPVTPNVVLQEPNDYALGRDVIFVVDSTVSELVFRAFINFIKNVVKRLPVDSGHFQVGLVTYSNTPRIYFHLNRFKSRPKILSTLNKISYAPGENQANLASVFRTVRTRMFTESHGDRRNATNVLILLSGSTSANARLAGLAIRESLRLKERYTHLFTVGMDLRDTTELDRVTTYPHRTNSFKVYGFRELTRVLDILSHRFNQLGELIPPPVRRIPKIRACKGSADLVFMLDSSGSVMKGDFEKAKIFLTRVLTTLDIDNDLHHVGLVTFSSRPRRQFHLNRYTTNAAVKDAIMRAPYQYGSTNIAAALEYVRRYMLTAGNGDRFNVPNVIILITNGNPNMHNRNTQSEARNLRRAGVTIVTVAIGFSKPSTELEKLTSEPLEENLIYMEKFDDLIEMRDTIMSPICKDIDHCVPHPCENGAKCIDQVNDYKCVCNRGYFGNNCDRTCDGSKDVVFMMDSTDRVGDKNFQHLKLFVQSLVQELALDTCDIRVGVMKYNTLPMIEVDLGQYRDVASIQSAIDRIHWSNGKTNIALALHAVRTKMFNGNPRKNVTKIAYLFADGKSNVQNSETIAEAELAIGEGIHVVPVGIAVSNTEEMDTIAQAQGMTSMTLQNYEHLNGVQNDVLQPLFSDYIHCSSNPCRYGGTCVEKPGGFSCKCIPGFTGDLCQNRCNTEADVVFVVDVSSTMRRTHIRSMKRFLRSIIKRMQFRKGQKFRVAIVEHASTPKVLITLSEGRRKRHVMSKMSTLKFRGYTAELVDTLKFVRTNVLQRIYGDRPSTPNYVILLTGAVLNAAGAMETAGLMKRDGTRVIGVGVFLRTSHSKDLQNIVSIPPVENAFHVTLPREWGHTVDHVMRIICEDEDQCARRPCQHSGICKDKHGSYVCDCMPGYSGKNCERTCQVRADVAIVLDTSGSVSRDDFRKVLHFVQEFVQELPVSRDQIRIGMGTYSTRSKLAFYLNQFETKEEVINAIASAPYRYGDTNSAAGLRLMRNRIFNVRHGDRSEAMNIDDGECHQMAFIKYASYNFNPWNSSDMEWSILYNIRNGILITNGVTNIQREKAAKEATLLKKQGTHLFAVGVALEDVSEIKEIASTPTGKNSLRVYSYDHFDYLKNNLTTAICMEPNMCDYRPCYNNAACTAGLNTYTCACPRGFIGQKCEYACHPVKDIAFLVDGSVSIGERNFKHLLEFVASIVETLYVSHTDGTRISLITFGTEVKVDFSFDRYQDKKTILYNILQTRYTPGNTNLAGAVSIARKYVFQKGYGMRANSDHLAVIISDGDDNVNMEMTFNEASLLRREGVKVIALGIGLNRRTQQTLYNVATKRRNVLDRRSFINLHKIKHRLITQVCKNPI